MPPINNDFSVSPWTRDAITGWLGLKRPFASYGISEFDVTDLLTQIRVCRRELGIAVSLHGVVLYYLAQAALKHPGVLTYRHRKRLITFDDADIGSTMMKKAPSGGRLLAVHIFRAAQSKSMARIQWELRTALRTPIEEIPRHNWTRRLLFWRMRRNPFLFKRNMGNMFLTNLQSPGLSIPLHVIAPNPFTMCFAIGPISEKVILDAQGKPLARKMLSVVGSADHAVIDGFPLTLFCRTLQQLFESAAGLGPEFISEIKTFIEAENKHEPSELG